MKLVGSYSSRYFYVLGSCAYDSLLTTTCVIHHVLRSRILQRRGLKGEGVTESRVSKRVREWEYRNNSWRIRSLRSKSLPPEWPSWFGWMYVSHNLLHCPSVFVSPFILLTTGFTGFRVSFDLPFLQTLGLCDPYLSDPHSTPWGQPSQNLLLIHLHGTGRRRH